MNGYVTLTLEDGEKVDITLCNILYRKDYIVMLVNGGVLNVKEKRNGEI